MPPSCIVPSDLSACTTPNSQHCTWQQVGATCCSKVPLPCTTTAKPSHASHNVWLQHCLENIIMCEQARCSRQQAQDSPQSVLRPATSWYGLGTMQSNDHITSAQVNSSTELKRRQLNSHCQLPNAT
jgi:hypothetical protein